MRNEEQEAFATDALIDIMLYLSERLPTTTNIVDLARYGALCIHFVERTSCCLEHGWPKFLSWIKTKDDVFIAKLFGTEQAYVDGEKLAVQLSMMEVRKQMLKEGVPFDEAEQLKEAQGTVYRMMRSGVDFRGVESEDAERPKRSRLN